MTQPPPVPKTTRNRATRVALWASAGGLLVVLGCVLLRIVALQPFKLPTRSMAPTLLGASDEMGHTRIADHILVEKVSYWFRPPRRGEIVVFRTDDLAAIPATSRGKYYVQRVVGLPGETISIQPPRLLINDQPVTAPPILVAIQSGANEYGGYVIPEKVLPAKYIRSETDSVTLGPDEYFLLGDNSRSSLDSRFFGPVKRGAIVGRVWCIYMPLERSGPVQ